MDEAFEIEAQALAQILAREHPDLTVVDLPVVTRFLDPLDGQAVIDLMKPVEDLYAEAFRSAVPVGKSRRALDPRSRKRRMLVILPSCHRFSNRKGGNDPRRSFSLRHNDVKVDTLRRK